MHRELVIGLLAASVLAGPAHAQQGDVLVRLRGILVAPNERSGGIHPSFPTEKVRVDNSFMPELDFTYMITKNIGTELILATTKHHANGRTGTTGTIGRLASTWVLPPTLTLQYHLAPEGAVRPYIGAGINYTIFYSEKASSALEAAVGNTNVAMKNSVGYALQAGVDLPVGKRSFFNLDIKYVDIDTTATLTTTAIGAQKVRVHLDPLIVGIGLGRRF